MHAYLFVTRGEIANSIIKKYVPDAKRVIPFTIAKIADTKELIRQTATTFPEKTVYLLDNFDKASLEAQNAFLKSLEEAQKNIVYLLAASREEAVLPTIVSRCQVVRIKRQESGGAQEGEKVKLDFATISKITKREDAVAYLENLISSLHKDLPESARVLKYADEALARIKANANPTLQLTWLVLNLSRDT